VVGGCGEGFEQGSIVLGHICGKKGRTLLYPSLDQRRLNKKPVNSAGIRMVQRFELYKKKGKGKRIENC